MKKILMLGVMSVMAISVSAYAMDDVANERFHQKSGNFGGTALSAKAKNTSNRAGYAYNRSNNYVRGKSSSAQNSLTHNGTLNSYTANKN